MVHSIPKKVKKLKQKGKIKSSEKEHLNTEPNQSKQTQLEQKKKLMTKLVILIAVLLIMEVFKSFFTSKILTWVEKYKNG